MKAIDPGRLLEVGIALSAEKDTGRLLETILTAAMDICACDAGTLYICDGERLHFKIMITRSMGVFLGGTRGEIALPAVPLTRRNVCACSVLEGRLINIPDAYECADYDFSGTREYDARTGYRSGSFLVVPMENGRGEITGVLQLINALDEAGGRVPFDSELERVVLSLGAQAAICLENMNYAAEIEGLLDSLVRVVSTAIDERTPYNANHTRNMVRYAGRFIEWLRDNGGDCGPDPGKERQFIMSVWLHDVGKLITPLEIMNKESRLGPALDGVLARFDAFALMDRIRLLQGEMGEEEYGAQAAALAAIRALVLEANGAGFLPDAMLERVEEAGAMRHTAPGGGEEPYLTPPELAALRVRRGTLTDAERAVMEGHVVMTRRLLGEMNFPKSYGEVPDWASKHHEYLDGSGYPGRVGGDRLPAEARLLTILDIFDALTARDRPYKPGMPADRAFAILDSMAAEGKLDGDMLALFKRSGAWEEG